VRFTSITLAALIGRGGVGWEQLLAWVSGKVDEQLRPKVEYLVAENRILRSCTIERRLHDERMGFLRHGQFANPTAPAHIRSVLPTSAGNFGNRGGSHGIETMWRGFFDAAMSFPCFLGVAPRN
jgi:hypothetical protein